MEIHRSHILSNFEIALNHLRSTVLLIAELTQKNLLNAFNGLMQRDNNACNKAIADDDEIDALEIQIDREGIELMSRFQPVASDLREVVSSIKIGTNIERIADQGVNIARRARKINKQAQLYEISLLIKPGELAFQLFKNAMQSFAEKNDIAALSLKIKDKELDILHKEVTESLISKMQDDSLNLPFYLDMIFISRCFERIGDHSCNIAEDVVFAISAKDIRHSDNQEI